MSVKPIRGLAPVKCASVEVRGTSLAAMVCADVLARWGVPVRLVGDEKLLGRSFRLVDLGDGVKAEAGARLLELDYGDPDIGIDPNPRAYVYGHHRAFIGLIRTYVEELVKPRRADLWLDRNGVVQADFLLSSNLHSLGAHCTHFERRAIEREARVSVATFGRYGLRTSDLLGMSYRYASGLVHGWTFHRAFLEPKIDAILGVGEDVPALDHRLIWLPLFRPGEVLDAIRGESDRPVREMHVGMGAMVEALLERVRPLLGASLPSGPVSVVQDVARIVGRSAKLQLVWSQAASANEVPAVTWVGGSIFRQTEIDGIRCWEMNARSSRPGMWSNAIGEREVKFPLTSAGPIDTHAGLIGAGSFNEMLAQGISCAAWRIEA